MDILNNIQNHSLRVQQYAQEDEMKQKDQAITDSQNMKDQVEADRKMKELEIKQQALMSDSD